jgi:hypothetical protein
VASSIDHLVMAITSPGAVVRHALLTTPGNPLGQTREIGHANHSHAGAVGTAAATAVR